MNKDPKVLNDLDTVTKADYVGVNCNFLGELVQLDQNKKIIF